MKGKNYKMKQTKNTTEADICVSVKPITMRKRIGSTMYNVGVYFNQNATETMDDKILRLIKNDLNCPQGNGIIGMPQTGWLPERSSV